MADLVDRLKETVGNAYRIEKELGGGGMSRVFLAEEIELGRRVVIKVLPPEMAADVNRERFHREIQLAARLQHPHVVSLLTAGAEGDLLYYVMPFIEGESLRAKLTREGELPVGEAVRLLKEIVDALAYAHRNGVVHRDIKPDNVLLSEGHAVVTDFGVAKAVTASSGRSSLTSLGVALGTPAYMAPEQATADPHTDHRADIYAIGALAYEMVCGRPPFTGASPQAVMAAHVTETPEPVTKHRSAASENLNVLIMRCLEKKAADRWQSAAELLPQLEAMTTPSGGLTPTGTAPIPAVNAETMVRQSHPVRVTGVFGLASIALLGVVYFLMMQLGLPDWVLPGAVALLLAGLPIILFTGHLERRRAIATTTGIALPTAAAGVHGWFTWRNAIVGGGVAFAALGIGTTSYMAMRVLGIGPAGTLMGSGILEEKERLVLAEFENRTSDSTLGSTVTELLRIGLAQSTVLRILEQAQLGDVLARMQRPSDTPVDRALAMEVAQREGLKAVVTGEILQVGTGYALSASLVSAYGEVLTAQQETAGDAGEIIAAVGSLARKIRERIGESLKTVRRDPLERVTTSSLQSLRLYSQALQAENGGDDPRAVELLEEAVALDSTFAMAYRKIGVILGNNFEQADRMIEATTRAYELRDRLSERERYHTVAVYHIRVTDERERAIGAYRTLLEAFPDDYAATHNTGVLNGQLRNYATAEEFYGQAVELDSSRTLSYINLAGAQRSQQKYDEADQTLELLAQRYPDIPQLSDARINQALARRDLPLAEEQLRRLAERQRGSLFMRADISERLAYLTALQGRVTEAQQHWQDAMTATEQRELPDEYLAKASRLSAAYSVLLGEPARGLAVLDAALERYPLETMNQWNRPYYWLIWGYIQAGETARARALLDELGSTQAVEVNRSYERWYHRARGFVAGSEGRSDEALEAFKRFDQDAACYPCALATLSRGFDLTAEADSAVAYYERYAELPWRPLIWDYMELPVSYRRLGELYEERGERDKAADYYGRFVELWSDADAELQPVVEDVRGRIARLVGER